MPNLQSVRVLVNGAPKMQSVCTDCLRSGRVVKAARGLQAQCVAQGLVK